MCVCVCHYKVQTGINKKQTCCTTDKPATDKADIFALGCVMFEMLTLDFPHMEMLPKESDYENIADFEIAFEEAEHLSDSSLGQALTYRDFERLFIRMFQFVA